MAGRDWLSEFRFFCMYEMHMEQLHISVIRDQSKFEAIFGALVRLPIHQLNLDGVTIVETKKYILKRGAK